MCRVPQKHSDNLREPGRASHSMTSATNCCSYNVPYDNAVALNLEPLGWVSLSSQMITVYMFTWDVCFHHTQKQGMPNETPKDTMGLSTLNQHREGDRSKIRCNRSVNHCIHFLSLCGLASLIWSVTQASATHFKGLPKKDEIKMVIQSWKLSVCRWTAI